MVLDICIRRYGRVYCWDSEHQRVIDGMPRIVEADQCPSDVLMDLLCLAQKEKETERENRKPEDCIVDGQQVYCADMNGKIYRMPLPEQIPVKDCPDGVIEALLKDKSREG